MIVLNTNAAYRLYAWCLCGFCLIKSGNDLVMLKKQRKVLKFTSCPKCGALWMSFEIREER
jgi:Zn-finger nucleic acid-binding protein